RTLGGRYARRRHHELHRQNEVQGSDRTPARCRALHATRRQNAALPIPNRRSCYLDADLDGRIRVAGDDRSHVRIRVPRRQLRIGEHPARRAGQGSGRCEKGNTEVTAMRTKLVLVALVGVGLAAAASVAAHHAFGGEFDPNKPVLLKGPVTKVEWVNPHAWIHMDVKKPDGTTEEWMVEGGTPNTLLRRGIT